MMFTRKQLIGLIVPLIVEQVFVGTIGLADVMMIAPLGETAISGISLVNSINILFHSIFTAASAGGGILCAQYLGKRDERGANMAAKQLLVTYTVIAILIAVICCLGNRTILEVCYKNAEPEVMNEAVTYFYVSALAYPFILIFDACASVFRGMGEAKIPLYGSTFMCIGNIVLNAVFIYGLEWGVFGAGFASLVAKFGGAALAAGFLMKEKWPICFRRFRGLPQTWAMQKNLFRLSLPMCAEDGLFHTGKLLVQGVVTSFGTTGIAANAVALAIGDFVEMPVYAFGLGLTTVIGQCIGAGEKEQAKYYAKRLLAVSFTMMAVLSLGSWILAESLVGLYRLTPETARIAIRIVKLHAISCTLFWIFAFNVPCILKAASDVNFMLCVSIFSMWTFRVGCSYLFREYTDLGVLGIWVAMGIDWGFRGMVFLGRFRSGKWMNKLFI